MTNTRFTLAEKGTDSSHDEVGFLVHKDIVSAVLGLESNSMSPSNRFMHQHLASWL